MIKRVLSLLVLVCFLSGYVLPPQVRSQGLALPDAVTGAVFSPAVIKGLQIFPNDPLKFDFIMDTADSGLKGDALKVESEKLIKYFLASLTIPETDMWVNLSPLEPDRIIPEKFGETGMGRDLLGLDKLLKQTASSLTDPDSALGQEFWDKVYARAQEKFGASDVPADMINKVWIMPQDATVYENGDKVFVVGTKLKVMLETDFLASKGSEAEEVSNQVMREVIIPVLEREVNAGKAFAPLRQIYYSMILATWFKRNLKESILGKAYLDRNMTLGIDILDKQEKLKIYDQYLQAFKKGAYCLIREEVDPVSREMVPRKYFSGGILPVKDITTINDQAQKADGFRQSMVLALPTLLVLSVFLNACDEAPKIPRELRPENQRTEQSSSSDEQVSLSNNSFDNIYNEFAWAQWAQDSIQKFRGMMGPDFENKSPREQIIELGHFIKSPSSGLGIVYDRKFLRNDDEILRGGDFEQTIQSKRTVCLGFARMLYFMLGHSIEILDVPFSEDGHAMNLIALEGGKVMLVDLSTNVQDGFIMSGSFVLDEIFDKDGDEYHLKPGKTIPWDNQNFNPAEDLDQVYKTFKISPILPYNTAEMFLRFKNEKTAAWDAFDQGNALFDDAKKNKSRGAYQEAVVSYNDAITRAGDLKVKLGGRWQFVVQDPGGALDDLDVLISKANSNIQAAIQNIGNLEAAANAPEGTIITQASEAEIKKFEKENKEIQRLMQLGANAIAEGNRTHNSGKYKVAKTYFLQVKHIIKRLKEKNQVCKENPHVLDGVEDALDYNLAQLKDFAQSVSTDDQAADKASLLPGKSVHFIFEYHYSRADHIERLKEAIADEAQAVGGIDLNAKNLNIQVTGRKIDMARFYGVTDLAHARGFTPMIMNILPVTDIASLLGTNTR